MAEKPVILVTRKLPDAVEARLARDYSAHFNTDDQLYSRDELLALSEGVDGIFPCHTEHFSAEVIAALPNRVRIVANMSVGVDHVDLAAAKARGLTVTNTPDVLSDATAEIALLLLLGAARRAGEGEQLVRSGNWRDWSPSFMVGTQVTGKRLGIIGMGRVGQVIAQRARGFDMTIHYHNRTRIDAASEKGAIYHDSIESLLPQCEFLSLNCPAKPDTVGLINAATLALLPKGAILVNTARGAIVDDEALIAALRSGQVAAAGLDVYNNEPKLNPGYVALANTFLLPHIGSATKETRDAMGFRACDNLDAFFSGEEPQDRVA